MTTAKTPTVVVIDDLRTFTFDAIYARTSDAGLKLIDTYTDAGIDELWLDHDLGGDDTIMPIIDELARRAFEERKFPVGRVYIHTSNPAGAATMVRVLSRWGYRTRRVGDLTGLLAP